MATTGRYGLGRIGKEAQVSPGICMKRHHLARDPMVWVLSILIALACWGIVFAISGVLK